MFRKGGGIITHMPVILKLLILLPSYHPPRARSQSDSSSVLSRPRGQRGSARSPLTSSGATSRSSSFGSRDLHRQTQPGRHSLNPVRKAGEDLHGAQTKQERRVRSPLQKSARVMEDEVGGESGGAVFEGHLNGKEPADREGMKFN